MTPRAGLPLASTPGSVGRWDETGSSGSEEQAQSAPGATVDHLGVFSVPD